jgi:hypothetical protein
VAKKRLLAAVTPLGHRVVLTRDRWREIVRFKHPALAGYEEEVRACLCDPEVVRASAKDADVHLYYRTTTGRYLCVVVGGEDLQARFVITAYFTDGLKKGRELWTK